MDGAVTVQEIQESLSFFDINAKDDAIDKLLEVAQLFRMDAESIVDDWLAYHSTHGCSLNKDNVEKLLLEKTRKNRHKNNQTPSSTKKKSRLILNNSINSSSIEMEDYELLSAYGAKNIAKPTPRTPYSAKKNENSTPSHVTSFSPTAFSPSAQLSQKYSSRTNSGEVVITFGPSSDAVRTYRGQNQSLSISVEEKVRMKSQYKYMFQKIVDLSDVMNSMIEGISEAIKSKYPDVIEDFQPCTTISQEPIFITGRICCDQGGGVGRLNAQSVLLQGDKFVSNGKQISIDLSQVDEYSLFPGQVTADFIRINDTLIIVVLKGTNPTGQKFIATEVFLSTPNLTGKTDVKLKSGPLGLLIAAGPFTTIDGLSYEPLHDLLRVVEETKPDVTIIIGPIADVKHPELSSAKYNVPYEDVIVDRLGCVVNSLKGLTNLVFVSSVRDVGCHPVYPQAPYSMALPSKDIHFVQDPCVLDIEGVKVAVTANDILFHLSAEEINKNGSGPRDRIGKLAQHVINQRSFYPLCPSHESINVDWIAAERYGGLTVHPDILILPSDLKYFFKQFEDCVCVNPGRLAKGTVGGTYARILIEPDDSGGISDGISGNVLKI